MHRFAALTIGTLLSARINVELCFFFFFSGSLQIVSVGKHVKGYHYIMANLVRGAPVCLIAVCLCVHYIWLMRVAALAAVTEISLMA